MNIELTSRRVLEEFASFNLGKLLGSGMSRDVYQHPFCEDKIIKVENDSFNFQNVAEWNLWKEWQYDDIMKKWLAPCFSISDSGTFLIMAKTEPLNNSRVPKKVPSFLTDHKKANFGLLNNRVVCHDYGYTRPTYNAALVNWRGE
ncbi:MAG: hypothetical protein CMC15_18750 [Flavobacteriaceae bacterium]|nr:hypothetical protein [Flavobacteriaceae bacterium]